VLTALDMLRHALDAEIASYGLHGTGDDSFNGK
jgi:hypothetical protein